MIINHSYSIVGSIKVAAKIRVMDTGTEKVEDPSLEVIKLLWMLINKHASNLNEGTFKADTFTYLDQLDCYCTTWGLHGFCIVLVALQLKSATHESSCAMTLNCIASNFTSCFISSSTPDLNHCKCLLQTV